MTQVTDRNCGGNLCVTLDVIAKEKGRFGLDGNLFAGDKPIAYGMAAAELNPGPGRMEMVFCGKTIAVDTSYGSSAMSDTWSSQPATTLNALIANGVIGVNISNNAPSNYQTLIQNLGTLATTCR